MPKRTKSRAFYILKYLWLYTDDEHPASISDLTDYLAKNGMEAHRTTVSADIAERSSVGSVGRSSRASSFRKKREEQLFGYFATKGRRQEFCKTG